MFIKVAGEKKEYPEGLTVKELIEQEDVNLQKSKMVTKLNFCTSWEEAQDNGIYK